MKPCRSKISAIAPGTRLRMIYAGGGGYGDPKSRDADALARDLRDEYVTPAAARAQYRAK